MSMSDTPTDDAVSSLHTAGLKLLMKNLVGPGSRAGTALEAAGSSVVDRIPAIARGIFSAMHWPPPVRKPSCCFSDIASWERTPSDPPPISPWAETGSDGAELGGDVGGHADPTSSDPFGGHADPFVRCRRAIRGWAIFLAHLRLGVIGSVF